MNEAVQNINSHLTKYTAHPINICKVTTKISIPSVSHPSAKEKMNWWQKKKNTHSVLQGKDLFSERHPLLSQQKAAIRFRILLSNDVICVLGQKVLQIFNDHNPTKKFQLANIVNKSETLPCPIRREN